MEEKAVHYGEVLKNLVKSKGFTTVDVSKKLNMTTQGVYNIYRTQSPRVDVMIKVARAIGVEFSTLELLSKVDALGSANGGQLDQRIEKQTEDILGEREHFRTMMERLTLKMDQILAHSVNAREVIDAKDQVIKMLKEKI